MGPVTALDVAGNAVRFVDFTIGIITESRRLRRWESGDDHQNSDIAFVCTDLSQWTTKLRDGIAPSTSATVLLENDQAILLLCQKCIEVSCSLATTLDKICGGKQLSRWRSVRKALLSAWKQEEIDFLERKLSSIRSELESRLMVDLRTRVNGLVQAQLDGFADVEQATHGIAVAQQDSQAAIERGIEDQAQRVLASVGAVAHSISDTVHLARKQSHEGHSRSLADIERLTIAVAGNQVATFHSL